MAQEPAAHRFGGPPAVCWVVMPDEHSQIIAERGGTVEIPAYRVEQWPESCRAVAAEAVAAGGMPFDSRRDAHRAAGMLNDDTDARHDLPTTAGDDAEL